MSENYKIKSRVICIKSLTPALHAVCQLQFSIILLNMFLSQMLLITKQRGDRVINFDISWRNLCWSYNGNMCITSINNEVYTIILFFYISDDFLFVDTNDLILNFIIYWLECCGFHRIFLRILFCLKLFLINTMPIMKKNHL